MADVSSRQTDINRHGRSGRMTQGHVGDADADEVRAEESPAEGMSAGKRENTEAK
jgi:hypothetical protein